MLARLCSHLIGSARIALAYARMCSDRLQRFARIGGFFWTRNYFFAIEKLDGGSSAVLPGRAGVFHELERTREVVAVCQLIDVL